jgi:hypothetical protein
MQLMDLISAAGGLGALSQQVGLSESQTQAGAAALLPAIVAGFQRQAGGGGGVGGLLSMLAGAGGAGLLDNVIGSEPTNVGQGNTILGQIFGSKDVSRDVAQQAAQSTGLDAAALKKMLPILAMLAAGVLARQGSQAAGGRPGGGLGGLLDRDGDGSALDDVLGMAGKVLGRLSTRPPRCLDAAASPVAVPGGGASTPSRRPWRCRAWPPRRRQCPPAASDVRPPTSRREGPNPERSPVEPLTGSQ